MWLGDTVSHNYNISAKMVFMGAATIVAKRNNWRFRIIERLLRSVCIALLWTKICYLRTYAGVWRNLCFNANSIHCKVYLVVVIYKRKVTAIYNQFYVGIYPAILSVSEGTPMANPRCNLHCGDNYMCIFIDVFQKKQ